ncbi:phosphate/phosphite/phosphonate ABC transporter substrate-binding protein [Gammaproteobacteria bacterium AB-CW1]|uniref:Phosphate/phosphite/phosphonate ABC transporter substrate-binding protein n=1 Tax=Natronospira elongata TaxID=3110268 RepID=A0AAP6MKM1_9GAMM|nr:phosphate/phosphite/phosphonate ABC transporter substrate-binding protein [Gammaproteobacteria bacterium AB-CW1]
MHKYLISLFAVLVLLVSACSSQDAGESSHPTTLRFADTGIEGMEELNRTFGAFAEALEKKLDIEIEFFPVSNRTAAVNALQHSQVDIVLAGPSEYVAMASRLDVKKLVGIERAEYGTAFVVPMDSPARTLQDLKGKRIAMKDPGSTTGHITPSWMLHEAGFDLDRDAEILLLDGARLEALINGDVHALGSGVRDFRRIEQRAPGQFRILAESDTMPRDVFVARASLADDYLAAIREVIMANSDELMQAILAPGEREKYRNSRFVDDLTEEEYDVVRQAYALLGFDI